MASALKKRKRTVISSEQLHKLEEAFRENIWPNKRTKEKLAQQLNKSDHFITVWFQNRRAKWRKEEKRTRLDGSMADKSSNNKMAKDIQRKGNDPKNSKDFIMQVEEVNVADDAEQDATARADYADDAGDNAVVATTSKAKKTNKKRSEQGKRAPESLSNETKPNQALKMNDNTAQRDSKAKPNEVVNDVNAKTPRQNAARVRKIAQKTQPNQVKNPGSVVGRRPILGGSKLVAVSRPSNLIGGNQSSILSSVPLPVSRMQTAPFPMIIKTDNKLSLRNFTIATTQEAPQGMMPSNPRSVLRGVTSTGSTFLLSIGPTSQAATSKMTATIQKVSPPGSATLFHALMRMLCVAEGGIISTGDPEFSTGATDYLYGIRINGDTKVVFEKYTGLSLVPIKNHTQIGVLCQI